jgi:hypothetical protein
VVGEIDQEYSKALEDVSKQVPVSAALLHKHWTHGNRYQQNDLIIDLRKLDPDGTLDLVKYLDRDTNKFTPIVEMVSGCLIVKVRKDK